MKKARPATERPAPRWLSEASFAATIASSVLIGWFRSAWLPIVALVGLMVSLVLVALAWSRTHGLALRPALAWSGLAVLLGAVAEFTAISTPPDSGWSATGHWSYLASLATLAALISIFGARNPGGGAWAILMGLLVLVFLIPWLEGSGLRATRDSSDRLRLDAPWSIFFAALAIAGVTNYLPTCFGWSAVLVAASLAVEFLGLTHPEWPTTRRAIAWSLGPILLSLGVFRAWIDGRRRTTQPPGLASLWPWFQDGWGVVWSVRVRERFNRAAESAGWPIRLSWHGIISSGDDADANSPVAEATFVGLIRRFASADRIADAARNPCPPGDRPGQ